MYVDVKIKLSLHVGSYFTGLSTTSYQTTMNFMQNQYGFIIAALKLAQSANLVIISQSYSMKPVAYTARYIPQWRNILCAIFYNKDSISSVPVKPVQCQHIKFSRKITSSQFSQSSYLTSYPVASIIAIFLHSIHRLCLYKFIKVNIKFPKHQIILCMTSQLKVRD